MEQKLPGINRSISPDFKDLQKQGIGVYQPGNRSQSNLNQNADIANLRYNNKQRIETSMMTIQEQRAIAKERVLQETESSMNNKLKTKTHIGIPLDEAGNQVQKRVEKNLNNSTSRALLEDARKSIHFNGKAPGDYNLPQLTGAKPIPDSRNQNAPSFSMGRRSKMPFISSKHLGSFIVRDEHVNPEISVFDYYDSRNAKLRGLQTMAQDKMDAFKSLDQQLASAFSPSKNSKKSRANRQIGFTLNKLLAGSPGPQSQLLQDLDSNKKWEYKHSKAAKIGSHTKEFDKDRQFYANLLHLNKSKESPGPGMYDNEVEPLSPKKVRDNSPRQRKLNKSLDMTAASKIREKLEENSSKFEKKKASYKPRNGASIGKSRRKIDVTMFSPSFNGHIKSGLWH